MYSDIKNKNTLFKVLSLLFIFHTTLFSENIYEERNLQLKSICREEFKIESLKTQQQEKVVVLNGFDGMNMAIMLVLTSLLGVFFIRNEVMSLLE